MAELLVEPAGAGVRVRVHRRRAALEAAAEPPRREAAPGAEGRHRRRRADGDAARDAVPARLEVPVVLRDIDAVARRRARSRSIRERGRRAKPFLAHDRRRRHRLGAVRRLRPRARGGVRGARREARGARRGAQASRRTRSSPRTRRRSPSRRWAPTSALHFFNPVAVLPLVEIVRTPQTTDEQLATAWDVVKKLRKRGVLVADAPAFVVNRRADAHDDRADGRARARQHRRRDRRGDPLARHADGAVGAAADGRPARREPRARDDARGRTRTASRSPTLGSRGEIVCAAHRTSSRSARRRWRPSRTRRSTSSTRASSPIPPTSTRASSSAPAGRSSSAEPSRARPRALEPRLSASYPQVVGSGYVRREAATIAAAAACLALLAIAAPSTLVQDSWLTLVGGRLVATSGIPHHEVLTVWAHGHR